MQQQRVAEAIDAFARSSRGADGRDGFSVPGMFGVVELEPVASQEWENDTVRLVERMSTAMTCNERSYSAIVVPSPQAGACAGLVSPGFAQPVVAQGAQSADWLSVFTTGDSSRRSSRR